MKKKPSRAAQDKRVVVAAKPVTPPEPTTAFKPIDVVEVLRNAAQLESHNAELSRRIDSLTGELKKAVDSAHKAIADRDAEKNRIAASVVKAIERVATDESAMEEVVRHSVIEEVGRHFENIVVNGKLNAVVESLTKKLADRKLDEIITDEMVGSILTQNKEVIESDVQHAIACGASEYCDSDKFHKKIANMIDDTFRRRDLLAGICKGVQNALDERLGKDVA